MVKMTSWFALTDEKIANNRKAPATCQRKIKRRFGMMRSSVLAGNCTVITPPADIWLSKSRANR